MFSGCFRTRHSRRATQSKRDCSQEAGRPHQSFAEIRALMQRRALIADNAAGPQGGADAVLARFGFVRTIHVPDRDHAFARMQDERFDLVVLPLQDITPGELLALEREIRKASTVSVIGTAPAADTDLIIRAMRAGIHEFLVFPPSSEELSGSVDRLMRRSNEVVERGELVAVYSGKGGLGSTSVAVNLAHAFARNRTDARVALAD